MVAASRRMDGRVLGLHFPSGRLQAGPAKAPRLRSLSRLAVP